MPKLKYTNVMGEAVEMYGSPFHLSKWEGLGEVESDIQMSRSPFQHGSSFIGSQLQPRYMTIEMTIRGNTEAEVTERRRKVSSIFNPMNGLGILEYIDVTGVKTIKAVAESLPFYPDGQSNRGVTFQKAIINLVAPNPLWQDSEPTIVSLEDYVESFHFPFSFPTSFALRGDTGTIENIGHAPAPIKITFLGEAINPKITKVSTGETLRIRRTIPEGYSLVITTDFDNQSAQIIEPNGNIINAMGYLDLSEGWSFFNLDVGINELKFITDGGRPEVSIEYRNQYVSV